MMAVSDIVSFGFGSWSSVNKIPTLGFGSAEVFVDPSCTITTGITMPSNSISTNVTMTANSGDWDVTMPANSISEDVGMGCGNQ